MPLNLSGFLLTLSNLGISSGNLLTFYDFAESGAIINKAPAYSGQFSGALSGSNSFYYGSGTGFNTNGNLISIRNTGNFYSTDFTHIFVLERSGTDNDNLFSSLSQESGAVNSGYYISLNNAGRVVFGYNDCSGPKSVTSTFGVNNLTNLAVTKAGNYISFFQFTTISNILDSSSFVINSAEIFPSDYADLFYANHVPAGFLKDYYSGFVYNYAYLNVPLSSSLVVGAVSGLYNTTVTIPASTGSTSINQCTDIFTLPIPATTFVTGSSSANAAALTRDGIVFLRPFVPGSKVYLDYDTGNSNISWNNQAAYDTALQNFTLNAASTSLPPVVYFNGQRVISGKALITGSFCNTGKVWEYDYQLTGAIQIDDADNYQSIDTVIYDVPSRNIWQRLFSGSGSVNINTGSGLAVYINGQRTLDYSASGTGLTLDFGFISGDIGVIDYYQSGYSVLGETYNTGFFFSSGSFIQNTSRVYYNGIRQLLGVDYLEIVSGTLLQGSPIDRPINEVVNIIDYTLWNL